MTEPRITERAEDDLDSVWAYIATDSHQAADRMIDAVLASSRLHVRFPGMGQDRRELGPGVRSFIVSPFVVFYRAQGDTIEVLRVLHSARDIDRMADLNH